MRVHVAFTPGRGGERTRRDRRGRPPGDLDDRAGARVRLRARLLLRARSSEALALRESSGRALLGGERNAVADRGLRRRRLAARVPRRAARARRSSSRRRTGRGRSSRRRARCERSCSGACSTSTPSRPRRASAGRTWRSSARASRAQFALDDAYCAGRIVQLLGAEPSDAAKAAEAIARAWPDAHEGLLARTYGPPGLEEDIAFCAQVSVLDVVPRLSRMVDGAAEIT